MARDYVRHLQQLLPDGPAWPRQVARVMHQLVEACSKEFARVDERAQQLLLEMDPRTTVELLPDWERIAGLPDECAPAPTSIEARQHALTARIISRGGWSGGPNVPFLKAVIAAFGYDPDHIIVRRFQYQPFTCDSACDDPLNSDDAGWIFVWEFVIQHGMIDDIVACQIQKLALAHLGLSFAFPLVFFSDALVTRSGAAVFTNPVTGDQTALGDGEIGTVYVDGGNTNVEII